MNATTAGAAPRSAAPQQRDGLFAGPNSIRVSGERRAALLLIVTVPVTLAAIGLVFHTITPTQIALLFVFGMVLVSLTRGRLLGSGIRARREEFPELIAIVERTARRLGVPPPQVFIRDDFFIPANAIGLGEPYALVLSSQYLQLFDDPDELAFIIGREIGHIAAGNTRLTSLIVASGRSNPIVASLFGGWMRQTEYSADRAGLLCCSSIDAAMKAIAVATFHASGRRVEAAMLADQRTDLESDLILRLGEVTGLMPYAVNRVRALETFAAGGAYRYWVERLAHDPLPVRPALGPADGPVDRRELASNLLRSFALLIDMTILSVIFDAVKHTTGTPVHHHGFSYLFDFSNLQNWINGNPWPWYVPYAAVLVSATGRTIGMMVFDLQVVCTDHRRAGIGRVIARYVITGISAALVIPLIIGFVSRLQFSDRFSGTRLIRSRMR